jgi:hypothetical protein
VAIVGKKLEHEVEQLHRFHFRFGHLFACLRSGLQTHGSTGRPSPHSARVPARFSGRGAPQSPGGPEVRIRFPPGESRVRTCMLAELDQTEESQIDLGRLLVRVAAPPRAAEGLGRLPVRVVVPPLGAADRGRRAAPTAAAPTEAPPITAPLTTAVKLPRFRGVELDLGDYGSVVTASIAAS